MKKLLIAIFAILLMAGIASATNVPRTISATDGPEVWLVSVYNNSSSTIDAGDVVIWDIDESTGDDDNYVNTTTGGATRIVAGVVYPVDIAAKSVGLLAVRGVVDCDTVADTDADGYIVADTLLVTSGTAGAAQASATREDEPFAFGHAVATVASASVKCFVNLP